MALTSIPGITLTDGSTGKVDLSIVEAKTMLFIASNTIGSLATATALNPGAIKGGTAVFRSSNMLKVKDYTGADQSQTPGFATQTINLDQRKQLSYELETFDLAGLETSAQLEALIAQGIGLAFAAYFDAVILSMIVKDVHDAYVLDATTPRVVEIADFSTTKDTAAMRSNALEFGDTVADITKIIDGNKVGVNQTDIYALTSLRGKNRLISSLPSSNIAAEKQLNGALVEMYGTMVGVHPFIGNIVPKGTSFDEENSYDWSNIEAAIWHKEACAVPKNFEATQMVINQNNANPRFIKKVQYGKGIVRKELTRLIVKVKGDLKDPVSKT